MYRILSLLFLLSPLALVAQIPTDFYGLNMSSNGELRFSNIETTTGAMTFVNPSPVSMDQFGSGISDMDPLNFRYFYIRANKVYTVDVSTGNVLHSPVITCSTHALSVVLPIVNIAYNWSDQTLYGLHQLGQELRFAKVDPVTGVMTILNNVPTSPASYLSGVSDIDPIQGRYFYIHMVNNVSRLLTVDLSTGSVVSNVALANPSGASLPCTNIAYNTVTDKIYGMQFIGGNWSTPGELRLSTANPLTGAVNIISTSQMTEDMFQNGVSDLNPFANTYTYTRGSFGNEEIVTADLATGNIVQRHNISNPNANPQSITNIECPYKVDIVPPPSSAFVPEVNGLAVNFRDQSPYARTHSWDFGDGSTHTDQFPSHIYSIPGTYTVTLTTANAAGTHTTSQVLTVTDLSTSAATALEDQVMVSPSPAQTHVRLELPGNWVGNGALTWFDLNGKQVSRSSTTFQEGLQTLRLPGALSNGVYFLELSGQTNGQSIRKKVLVAR